MAKTRKRLQKKIDPKSLLIVGADIGVVGREKELVQLTYALLTGEHMLMMGPAGTAKSMTAMNAFNAIDGAKVFNIHLTKQTTEEYVFGPLNIEELKKGRLVHETADSILDADFAFIDEFFDASDVLLRSLLGVLNERLWIKGKQRQEAVLSTAILTSNYQRENETTQAVLDRIIFKCEVSPSTRKTDRKKIYHYYLQGNGNLAKKGYISFSDIKKAIKAIDDPKGITISDEILALYDDLHTEYVKEINDKKTDNGKKYLSPRTLNKALKVLKASAYLNGRSAVEVDDLAELKYVFCIINKDIEEEVFSAVYERVVEIKKRGTETAEALNGIESQINDIPKDFGKLDMAEFSREMTNLKSLTDTLQEMDVDNLDTETKGRRDKLLSDVRNTIANIRSEYLQS